MYQAVHPQFNGGQPAESRFDGTVGGELWLDFVNALIIIFTLGICTPWAVCRTQSWKAEHTIIEGRRLRFDGTAMGLFGHWIKWFLLIIITFGIYALWVNVNMQKWITKHTHFA